MLTDRRLRDILNLFRKRSQSCIKETVKDIGVLADVAKSLGHYKLVEEYLLIQKAVKNLVKDPKWQM